MCLHVSLDIMLFRSPLNEEIKVMFGATKAKNVCKDHLCCDGVRNVSKRLTKMYQELLVNDLRHQVGV